MVEPTLEEHPFYDRPLRQRLKAPLIVFALAAMVFAAFAGDRVTSASPDNHFAYLADSYLHGTLEMRVDPPHGNDWASYQILTLASGQELRGIWWDRGERKFLDLEGNLYVIDQHDMRGATQDRVSFVSFPPMPAVLMLPGVALFGLDFNDVLFTIFFAALNAALMYVLLRRITLGGRTKLYPGDAFWLTAMFAVGTAHLWCSVQGAVWFTALVVGVTFTLLYMLASIDARRPFLAGLCLACAFATRTPLLFSVVFFAAFFFFPGGRLRRDWGKTFWRDGLLFVAAPLVVGITLLVLNYMRFHHLSEFGHTYLANGQIQRIKDYGLFNVHFLSLNLTALFALVPKFQPDAPYIVVSRHGLAIWFTTPALLYLAAQRPIESDADRLWRRAAQATVFVIFIPHIFYQNTGWVQFGYRFSMDYIAYLTLLLALGRAELTRWFKAAVVLGIGINAFGAITFGRLGQFYGEWVLEP